MLVSCSLVDSARCQPTFIRVLVHPSLDLLQPGAQRPRIHIFTVGVTQAPFRVALVDLGRHQANTAGELSGGIVVSINRVRSGPVPSCRCKRISGDNVLVTKLGETGTRVAQKGTVVGAQMCDVTVRLVAEIGRVVACGAAGVERVAQDRGEQREERKKSHHGSTQSTHEATGVEKRKKQRDIGMFSRRSIAGPGRVAVSTILRSSLHGNRIGSCLHCLIDSWGGLILISIYSSYLRLWMNEPHYSSSLVTDGGLG